MKHNFDNWSGEEEQLKIFVNKKGDRQMVLEKEKRTQLWDLEYFRDRYEVRKFDEFFLRWIFKGQIQGYRDKKNWFLTKNCKPDYEPGVFQRKLEYFKELLNGTSNDSSPNILTENSNRNRVGIKK